MVANWADSLDVKKERQQVVCWASSKAGHWAVLLDAHKADYLVVRLVVLQAVQMVVTKADEMAVRLAAGTAGEKVGKKVVKSETGREKWMGLRKETQKGQSSEHPPMLW